MKGKTLIPEQLIENTQPKPVFLAIPTHRYLIFNRLFKYLLNICYVICAALVTVATMLQNWRCKLLPTNYSIDV